MEKRGREQRGLVGGLGEINKELSGVVSCVRVQWENAEGPRTLESWFLIVVILGLTVQPNRIQF